MESFTIAGITINNAMNVDEFMAEHKQIHDDMLHVGIIDTIDGFKVMIKNTHTLIETVYRERNPLDDGSTHHAWLTAANDWASSLQRFVATTDLNSGELIALSDKLAEVSRYTTEFISTLFVH